MASGLISSGSFSCTPERRVLHRRHKDPFTLRKIVADDVRNSVGLTRARGPLDNDAVENSRSWIIRNCSSLKGLGNRGRSPFLAAVISSGVIEAETPRKEGSSITGFDVSGSVTSAAPRAGRICIPRLAS